MWCIPGCTWLAGHLGRLSVLLLSCIGMSLTWKQIKLVEHVEKMGISLKPIVRENHFIFSSEPLAFNCPFPSRNVCAVLPWSLFPPACGQNDRGSSLRIWLTEVTKPVTKASRFCLNDLQQSIVMTMVLQCSLLWGESSFGFFPICKIFSWYLEFSQGFSLLCSVYNYVITVSVNTVSSEIDLCRVQVRVKVHYACLHPVQCK